MRFIIICLGGLIGAKIFSSFGKKKNTTNNDTNDFWYKYNHPNLRDNSRYNNHCWNCGKKIDSYYEKKLKRIHKRNSRYLFVIVYN